MHNQPSSESAETAAIAGTYMTLGQNTQENPAPATVLVLGASGQIGRCMVAELSRLCPNAQLLIPSRVQLDMTDGAAVLSYLQQTQPDWLINCAAFTAVDAAEQDPLCAGAVQGVSVSLSQDTHSNTTVDFTKVDTHPNTQLNARLPQLLAQYWQSSTKSLTLLHFSSDYVYSGEGDLPWREDDTPAPLNAYGRAKTAGDRALLSALSTQQQAAKTMASRLYILRTSWVYHSHGQNFINTMLRLAAERDLLRVVDDQYGAPTPACWAASISGLLLKSPATSGLYHLAPSGVTSWYGVAYAALSSAVSAGLIRQVPELVAISSSDYPTPAKRPHNSRLDCQKLQQALGLEFADWQRLLREHIARRQV